MKITAINYLNTIPFIYGIRHSDLVCERGGVELCMAVPSRCADIAMEGGADIVLVPVAEVPRILATADCAHVISDFCISADDLVDTVALLSNCSRLSDIHTIYLDWHSRTSVQLVRILAREYWKLDADFVEMPTPSSSSVSGPVSVSVSCLNPYSDFVLRDGEAMLVIGDKVFELQKSYLSKWDLAHQWKLMTGLPFVFAVWVGVTTDGVAFEGALNDMLQYGVSHITEAVLACGDAYDHASAQRYLTENIQFNLSDSGREAMKLFWEKIITPG